MRPLRRTPYRTTARRHPERATLELAAAGATQVLGADHRTTKALAKASITMAPADLWRARLAVKTLRKDQRGPSPRRWKTEAPHVTRPTDQRRPAPAGLFFLCTIA